MAQYLDNPSAAVPSSDGDVEQAFLQQLQAWTPPTPRWADSAARAQIVAPVRRSERESAPPSLWQRLRRRVDLVGWVLERPIPGFGMMEDPNDPRVALYNQIMGGANRYHGPQATLLRYFFARA